MDASQFSDPWLKVLCEYRGILYIYSLDNLLAHIALAIVTFAGTNIDDLLMLSIYFSNPAFKRSNIVIGQYLGVMSLVGLSLLGLVLGKILEPEWIGLLGLVPIFLGLKDLIHLFKGKEGEESFASTDIRSKIQFLNVAMITIANGGDNLGVYAPLFASISGQVLIVYILVFMIMIALWCVLAFYFVSHPLIKGVFAKYMHIVLPFFLIFLGIWILIKSDTLSLFI